MKLMKLLMWALCLPTLFLPAHTPYCAAPHAAPQIVTQFTLHDLGPAGLTAEQLSKLEPLYSLAPSVNNRGQILYNTDKGAFFRDPLSGEYGLSTKGILVYGHALNNLGDAVVSLERSGSPIEWMRWSLKSTLNGPRPKIQKTHIAQLGKKSRSFFCAINDKSTVTGFREIKGRLYPLVWTPCTGLHPLGYCFHYDIAGFPRGINQRGAIVGYFDDVKDNPPFFWDCEDHLLILYNYRHLIDCQGWIELADMVISNDNKVFGTYVVKYLSSRADPSDLNSYFTYVWTPKEQKFKVLGLKDMRIAAINNSNTLVGSLRGHAMIRYNDQQPIDLNNVIATDHSDWELLEATSINDLDHIVGYGKYKGEIHLFLLEPSL